jgi:tetratricopeptide (TPR) repeat protein
VNPGWIPAWPLCLLLLGLVAWAFLPVLHNGFVNYDDGRYITANPHVQAGLSWANVRWAFESTAASNWHPLTWLSHMLDCQLFGLNPRGHHLTSLLIHAANCLLLFLLLRRLTGATARSFLVAALFGLHPLRVESVAWAAERKDVLSTLFCLLTLHAYASYARAAAAPPGASRPRAALFYALTLLAFALGLLSKPMLVTLPCLLLLLDFWPLNRLNRSALPRLLLEKLPLLALAAVSSAITFAVQSSGGATWMMGVLPFASRAENALVSYCRYLGKLFWPSQLSVIYPAAPSWPAAAVVLSALLLLGLSVLAVRLRRRAPYLLTGWFWFLGTLVPVLGLVAVGEQAMADRYTYLPLTGILIALVWGAHDLARACPRRRAAGFALAALALAACVAATRAQTRYWKDSETLFRHAVDVTGANYRAEVNLGGALCDEGRVDEAMGHFKEAVRLRPDSAEAHLDLGAALYSARHRGEAIAEFREAIRLKPGYADAHYNLGIALEDGGALGEAIQEYRRAAGLWPDWKVCHRLGAALRRSGAAAEAITWLQEAIRLNPGDDDARRELGEARGH